MIIVKGKPKNLSRKERKRQYIRIKNRIAEQGNGVFCTHHYIHEKTAWIDAYFIGDDKTVYNATIDTVGYAFNESYSNKFLFQEIDKLNGAKPDYSKINTDINVHLLSLFTDGAVTYPLKAIIDHGYRFGVGIEMNVPVKALSVENIIEAINAFKRGDYDAEVECTVDKDDYAVSYLFSGEPQPLFANAII